jgi:clan AA aspartic protease
MITGVVNAELEALVRLHVQGTGAQTIEVDAVLDSGFSGFLTLPSSLIATLGLKWLCRQEGLLADGSLQIFDVYAGTVLWDGHSRPVEIEGADAPPLIGMGMMQGYELRVQIVAGGKVALEALP